MSEIGICPHCGAKMVEYKHSLNLGLAHILGHYFNVGHREKVSNLPLDKTQYCNVQKLRYWGLIEQAAESEEDSGRGWWKITRQGKSFVIGAISIPRSVVTYRGEFVRFEGDTIEFVNISEGFQYRADYAMQAWRQLHGQSAQMSFASFDYSGVVQ